MHLLENWYISYQFKYKKYVEAISPRKKDAEDALHLRKIQLREGKFFDVKHDIFFEDAVSKFRKWCKSGNIKDSSNMYHYALNKHLIPFFKGFKLKQITPEYVEKFKAEKIKSLSPASVNRYIDTLKRIMSLCVDWGYLKYNHISAVKSLNEGNKRERFLTEDEIKMLLQECKLPYLKLIVQIALDTGLSKNEILHLKWSDINIDRKTIAKIRSKTGKKLHIPITETLVEILKESKKNENNSDLVIKSPVTNKPIVDFKKSYNNACERAGIKDFTFHDLRHTFASHFLMRTKDIYALQEILGHADIKTTKRYSHLLDEHKREAINKFDSLIK